MRKQLLFVLLMLPMVGVGQTWYSVSCNDIPTMETWCYGGGLAADISPINEPQLFVVDANDSTNIWQFGQTFKSFGVGSVPNNGWVTDTTNSYGLGLNSDLLVLCTADNWGVTWMSFEHRWNSDTLNDGGRVSYSCDGLNWANISQSSWNYPPEILGTHNFSQFFIDDSIPTFTGNSEDWITSAIGLQWYLPVFQGEPSYKVTENGCSWNNMDTVYFKFNFTSDSVETNQDGWIIRNITVGTHGVPSEIIENDELSLSLYPNPASTTIRIQTPTIIQTSRTRVYDMTGRLVYQESFKPEVYVSFLESGTYLVILETEKGLFRSKFIKE